MKKTYKFGGKTKARNSLDIVLDPSFEKKFLKYYQPDTIDEPIDKDFEKLNKFKLPKVFHTQAKKRDIEILMLAVEVLTEALNSMRYTIGKQDANPFTKWLFDEVRLLKYFILQYHNKGGIQLDNYDQTTSFRVWPDITREYKIHSQHADPLLLTKNFYDKEKIEGCYFKKKLTRSIQYYNDMLD